MLRHKDFNNVGFLKPDSLPIHPMALKWTIDLSYLEPYSSHLVIRNELEPSDVSLFSLQADNEDFTVITEDVLPDNVVVNHDCHFTSDHEITALCCRTSGENMTYPDHIPIEDDMEVRSSISTRQHCTPTDEALNLSMKRSEDTRIQSYISSPQKRKWIEQVSPFVEDNKMDDIELEDPKESTMNRAKRLIQKIQVYIKSLPASNHLDKIITASDICNNYTTYITLIQYNKELTREFNSFIFDGVPTEDIPDFQNWLQKKPDLNPPLDLTTTHEPSTDYFEEVEYSVPPKVSTPIPLKSEKRKYSCDNDNDGDDEHEEDDEVESYLYYRKGNLPKLKKIGETYIRLPSDFEHPQCSGQSDLEKSVLNSSYICKPTYDSRGQSHVPNKYEVNLNKIEDERIEFDYLIHSTEMFVDLLQEVLTEDFPTLEDKRKYMEDMLSQGCEAAYLFALNRLFEENMYEVFEELKKNPDVVIPGLINRLIHVVEHWTNERELCKEEWSRETKETYLRSLDYQGPLIKKNDPKNLTGKKFLSDVTKTSKFCLPFTGSIVLMDGCSLLVHAILHSSENAALKQEMMIVVDLWLPRFFKMDTAERRNLPHHKTKDRVPVNSIWYIFLRYFLVLIERLHILYQHNPVFLNSNNNNNNDGEFNVLNKGPNMEDYKLLLEIINKAVISKLDMNHYEEKLLEMYQTKAYQGYYLPKLVTIIVSKLKLLVKDNTAAYSLILSMFTSDPRRKKKCKKALKCLGSIFVITFAKDKIFFKYENNKKKKKSSRYESDDSDVDDGVN